MNRPRKRANSSIHLDDPCHPGAVQRDWINGHGKTGQEAARLMGVSRAMLNRLLSGAGRIAPKLAVQLESMGWSGAGMWRVATGPRPCSSTARETGGMRVRRHRTNADGNLPKVTCADHRQRKVAADIAG